MAATQYLLQASLAAAKAPAATSLSTPLAARRRGVGRRGGVLRLAILLLEPAVRRVNPALSQNARSMSRFPLPDPFLGLYGPSIQVSASYPIRRFLAKETLRNSSAVGVVAQCPLANSDTTHPRTEGSAQGQHFFARQPRGDVPASLRSFTLQVGDSRRVPARQRFAHVPGCTCLGRCRELPRRVF